MGLLGQLKRAIADSRFRVDGTTIREDRIDGERVLTAVATETLGNGGSSGSTVAMAKVMSGGPGKQYLADIYLTGRYEDVGGTWTERTTPDVEDAVLIVTQVAGSATVPAGTWLTVVDCVDHYEGSIPRWL